MPVFRFGVFALAGAFVACAQPNPPEPIAFPPAPAQPRLVYLGRLDEAPIDQPLRGAFLRWLHDTPTFLQTPLTRPFGLAAAGARLYVCDIGASAVVVFDFEAQETRFIEDLAKPVDIDIDGAGRIYVAEAGTGRISVFDASHKLRRVIDPPGRGFRPSAIALHGQVLYAADVESRALQRYDLATSNWLDPLATDEPLGFPSGLCSAGRRLWWADALDGGLGHTEPPGGNLRRVARPGELVRPKHLAADPNGRIIVTDASRQSLQIRDADGRILMNVDNPALLPLPSGVCMSREILGFYTNRIPESVRATAVVFVSNQSSPPGVAIFAYAPD